MRSSRVLRTRWFQSARLGISWRFGVMRWEWWVGARYDFAAEAVIVGVFGLVLVVTHR